MLHIYKTTFQGHEYTLLGVVRDSVELEKAVKHYLPTALTCAFCKRIVFPGTLVIAYESQIAHACHAYSACQSFGYITDAGEFEPIELSGESILVTLPTLIDQYRFFEAPKH